MNTSEHYGLGKPLNTEKYNINVFNTNADIIDAELYKLQQKNESQDSNLDTTNKSIEDIRTIIDTNKSNWEDKYTKNEIDNKLSRLGNDYITEENLKEYAQPLITGNGIKKITYSATKPETIEDGEIVFVYEE